jgi:putative SOS response-associated peptidase YedK
MTMTRELRLMCWCLLPGWLRERDGGRPGTGLIKARTETVAAKPSFKYLLRFSHCLIPATGFYEWRAADQGRGRGGDKVKYLFTLSEDAIFGFAGLCDTWTDSDGREVGTCTILTTTPNAVVAPIYDRMPVILAPPRPRRAGSVPTRWSRSGSPPVSSRCRSAPCATAHCARRHPLVGSRRLARPR